MRITNEWLSVTLHLLREHHGDTTSIEVKAAAGGLPQNLPESLCAFANMPDGGLVILGVDEASGFSVTGVKEPAQIEAGLASMAREAVNPSPTIDTYTFKVNRKSVVVGRIHGLPLMARPALYRGDAYLRQADGDYRMTPHELRMIEVSKLAVDQAPQFDVHPIAGARAYDLDSDLQNQFIQNFRSARKQRVSARLAQITSSEILRMTGVLTNNSALPGHDNQQAVTMAGLYALGRYPQGLVPALRADAAVSLPRSIRGREIANLEVFEGPMVDMFSAMLAWARENLARVHHYTDDGNMISDSEIPLTAIREVISNALVHRDLSPATLGTGKYIHMRLLPDRLIIQNPGGLKGVSLEQLESSDHSQAPVNQHLYAIAQNQSTSNGTSLIEGEGGGIREVFQACASAGLPRPLLIDKGVEFTAILFRNTLINNNVINDETDPTNPNNHARTGYSVEQSMPANDPITSNSLPNLNGLGTKFQQVTSNGKAIATSFTSNQQLTLQEVADASGLDLNQARYALKVLRKAGLITMLGKQGSKTTTYTLNCDTRSS